MTIEAFIPVIVALISAGVGGIALRFIGHWLDRKQVKFDQDAVRRQELRDENIALRKESDDQEVRYRTELHDLEGEIDAWKLKYYELRDEYHKLKFDTMKEIQTLNLELQKMTTKIEELKNKLRMENGNGN